MTRGVLCRRGLHDDWRRIESDRFPKGWYWRCVPCLCSANAKAQRAFAARGGEEYRRMDRRRKKIKRGALCTE